MKIKLIFIKLYKKLRNRYVSYRRRNIINRCPKIECKTVQFGSEYGGYRLVTDFIEKKRKITVLSFGIGEDLSFSEDIITKLDAEVYAFDPTPRTKIYVANHKLNQNINFHFLQYGLSDKNETVTFYFPKVQEYVSCSMCKQDWVGEESCLVEMRDFLTIVRDNGITCVDILKMDIEGSEFDVMDQILSCDLKIPQICLEVHDYLFSDGTNYKKLHWIMETMSKNGYRIAYLSKSNHEMTFLKVNG